jgi:hypothetical protein
MSEIVVAIAALFAIGMMGLGLAVFVKGAKEDIEVHVLDRAHPWGLG